jgi:hypothetical protein
MVANVEALLIEAARPSGVRHRGTTGHPAAPGWRFLYHWLL